MENHISFVENKVSKNVGILHKAKNIFSEGGLRTLYFSFVHSYLNYGNIAWGSTTQTKLKKLASKQRQDNQSNLCCKIYKGKNGRNESFTYLKT